MPAGPSAPGCTSCAPPRPREPMSGGSCCCAKRVGTTGGLRMPGRAQPKSLAQATSAELTTPCASRLHPGGVQIRTAAGSAPRNLDPARTEGGHVRSTRSFATVATLLCVLSATSCASGYYTSSAARSYFGFSVGIESAPPPPRITFVEAPRYVAVEESA